MFRVHKGSAETKSFSFHANVHYFIVDIIKFLLNETAFETLKVRA